MKIYFVGWTSDYDDIMIRKIGEQYNVESFKFGRALRYLFIILNKVFGNKYANLLTKTWANWLLRDLSPVDYILVKDTNFYGYIESIADLNAKKVLVLRNVVDEFFIDKYVGSFDLVASFDRATCEKNIKVKFLNQVFPLGFINLDNVTSKSNGFKKCYFLGMDKNRIKTVETIAELLKSMNVGLDFNVIRDKTSSGDSDFYVNKPITYIRNIDKIRETELVLEIVKKGQNGLTLRTLEAMFFNKKLITNNVDIQKYDFFSKDNVLVFDCNINEQDIVEFISSDVRIVPENILDNYTPTAMMRSIVSSVDSI